MTVPKDMQTFNIINPGRHAMEGFGILMAIIALSVSAALVKAWPRPIAEACLGSRLLPNCLGRS
ncbi:hypothetical protein OKW98_04750 [Pseudomonas sp. KU26590]|uniref:hypothetical protein n=1 Tax=Pseudomonas sp. KU26590 TaxID=2991051 RepID=UPI00223CC5D5|nr:hypothetical protein [Pseudomonas sp. KU26590]UZJ61047.1 hypothetical protein OKW98_04750 [Pseudomonas sp. KU26590]